MPESFKLHDRVGHSESSKKAMIVDREGENIDDEGIITQMPDSNQTMPGWYEVKFAKGGEVHALPEHMVLLEPALPF